jgi:type I restriction enzyme S subunit
VSDRVDPETAGLERYVAGEHMDTDDLRIRRWGIVGDGYLGPAFHMRFKPGQVLYGSRRTYLRKVAVPDFEGVTANTTFVLEPKDPAVLLPELLPYVMSSDSFHSYSIEQSKGSVNPYINFSDLASYEFALPPLEEKRRIATALGSIREGVSASQQVANRAKRLLRCATEELVWNGDWPARPVAEIAKSRRFEDGDWIETKDQSESGIRLIQLADIGEGRFLDASRRFISIDTFKRLKCKEVIPGDLLISRMADPIGRTCQVPDLGVRLITAVDVCIVRIDAHLHDPRFWTYVLNSASWIRMVASAAAGSTRTRVSRRNLEAIEVPMPPRAEQSAIANRLVSVADAVEASEVQAEALKALATAVSRSHLEDAG